VNSFSKHPLRALAAAIPLLATIAASPLVAQEKRVVEAAEFEVKLGFMSVGTGHLSTFAYDTVDGHATFHSILAIDGGFGPAKVRDRFESWGDAASWRSTRDVFSRRFVESLHEVTYRRNRTYEISPERGEWVREDGSKGKTDGDKPLDDLAMLFFARSLVDAPESVGDLRPLVILVERSAIDEIRSTLRVPLAEGGAMLRAVRTSR